ncbi:M56 family metallopeptidase [Roseibium aggregatum]|uniref:M56 family metallopeptidase n=1 Tax=Roseibium aggregatum TaxID=187304 RepID=A0A939J546_9HYPH|nr:M56 family metallopeptidase [Roseibium aggregatum]MBN9671850.1 M56 family metallopeptidase [Roseibium aggregatum]
MTLLNQMFDVYIDLNITLAFAATAWMAVNLLLARLGRKLVFTVQLGFLNLLFAVIFLSPAIVAVYQQLLASDVVPADYSLSLADYAVAQYLRGGIAIPAEDFQTLLGVRDRFTESVLTLGPGIGLAVALFLIGGFTWFGGRLAVNFLRLGRVLSACHGWRKAGRVRLLLSDTAPVPFSARGLLYRYVVIPSDLLVTPGDLNLVLKHEFQHLRQGDVEWEIGLELLRPLFFWNPFFYLWKSEVERLRELACDQKVTEDAKVDLKAYCQCLVRAAQAGFRKRREQLAPSRTESVAGVALLEVHEKLLRRSPGLKLRRRIEALLETDRLRPHRGIATLAVLPIAVAVVLTALSLQKPADWSQDRLMLSAIVNLDRLQTINSFGQRPLR